MKDKSGYIQIEPKMGDSDEGICGLGCWAKKVLSKAGNYILGAGTAPTLQPGRLGGKATLKFPLSGDVEELEEAILNTLKSGKDISMMKTKTHELKFHGMQTENDRKVRWSLTEIARRSK